MSRRRLDELASATEAEALSRGVTVARLELARRIETETRERSAHGLDVDRVRHHRMIDS